MVEGMTKEQLLEDIFLCEPITERGRLMLRELGLLADIKPSVFFDKGKHQLFVSSAVSSNKSEIGFEYSYTDIWAFANQRDDGEQNRETAIKKHFIGSNGTELYVQMGVVGNGKSIDLQYHIWEQKHAIPYRTTVTDRDLEPVNAEMTPDAVLIDVEEVEVAVDGGIEHRYTCPDSQRPLWLFCTKLFSTLMGYIKFLKQNDEDKGSELLKNAIDQFRQHFFNEVQDIHMAIDSENRIFCAIEEYCNEKVSSAFVFEEILKTMKSGAGGPGKKDNMDEAKEDVEHLLNILCFLMISVGLTRIGNKPIVLHILIDNIEDYIKHRGTKTWLLNADVRQIYEIIKDTADTFSGRIKRSQIVIPHTIAMRRTTRTLLDAYCDGDNQARIDKIVDVTGRVSLYEIWKKKRRVIWQSHLSDVCTEKEKEFIDFVDKVICRDIEGRGTSFQDMFARLMSHSLRREAHGLASVLAKIYDLKNSKQEQTQNIDFNNFSQVFLQSKSEPRFTLRQAMMQCYYDELVKSPKQRARERWKDLNLGYIADIRTRGAQFLYGTNGKRKNTGTEDRARIIKYTDAWSDITYRSLLRRILSILSQETDENDGPIPLYHTMSMYDLMNKLYKREDKSVAYCENIDQEETPNLPEKILDQLARVLWSSGLPDRGDNWGPFTLFRFSDGDQMIESADSLKDLLKRIWKSSAKEREDDQQYGKLKCGIRLSEAGAEFLYNGMTSYPFYLALYCNDLPPLPFLKSPELITHAIVKVYKEACAMCEKYEEEAEAWLRGSAQVELMGYFLPSGKTYRESVKMKHRNYLLKYRKYIKSYGRMIGITEEEIAEIENTTTTYIRYYSGLTEDGKRDAKSVWRCGKNCF